MQKWCRLLLLSRIPPKDCSMLHCFGCMVSMCFHWLLAFGIHSSSLGSKAFSGARAHFFLPGKTARRIVASCALCKLATWPNSKTHHMPKGSKGTAVVQHLRTFRIKSTQLVRLCDLRAFLKCSSDSSLLKWLKFRITPFTSLSGESHDDGKEGKEVLKDACKDIEELPPSKPEAIREPDHPGMIETFCGNTHRDTSGRGKLC